jgi:hypothetical protein
MTDTTPKVLTRHELRLRAKFDAVPYSALADATEHFFEHLIAVRQSATFYNTGFIRDSPIAAEKLLGYRRDAVAAVLANLYILAGALRSQRKVPVRAPLPLPSEESTKPEQRVKLTSVKRGTFLAQHQRAKYFSPSLRKSRNSSWLSLLARGRKRHISNGAIYTASPIIRVSRAASCN